jgi:hypothetical protein
VVSPRRFNVHQRFRSPLQAAGGRKRKLLGMAAAGIAKFTDEDALAIRNTTSPTKALPHDCGLASFVDQLRCCILPCEILASA